MDLSGLILLAIIAVATFYIIFIYNNLVSLKHAVSKAWSNIDVLLKQRHDELPKLVEVCKQYMQYETETLEKIIKARSAVMTANGQGDIKGLGQAESALRLGLGNLFALAENYPDLKANQNFLGLQDSLEGTENRISVERTRYNEAVKEYNVAIKQFPGKLAASMFGFGPAELFESNSAAADPVPVEFN